MDDITLIIRRAKRGNATSLDLSRQFMSSWPADVFRMTSLQELNVSNNQLNSIPEDIQNLQNLIRLDLNFNNITDIPPEILNLPNLQYLNLEGNPISLGNLTPMNIQQQLQLFLGGRRPATTQSTSRRAIPSTRQESTKTTESFNTTNASLISAFGGLKMYKNVPEAEIEEIQLGDTISQGGFSVVRRGIFRGTEVAVKVIIDPIITQELRDEFENEITMLNSLRHPGTVLLMGVCTRPPHLALIFEYANRGTVYDLLHRSRQEWDMASREKVILQLARVILFYHRAGAVHRDLKTLNMLLDENCNVKLCDFGLARFFNDLNKGTMQFSGTPAYMAPEIFKKMAYDQKVDIFAFGTIVWEILSRNVPMDGLDPSDIREKALNGQLDLKFPFDFPRKYIPVVEECRNPDPRLRPDMDRVIELITS